jgi:hypothetical protein
MNFKKYGMLPLIIMESASRCRENDQAMVAEGVMTRDQKK